MPIFGGCPYDDCNAPLVLPDPPSGRRGFQPSECERCNRRIWSHLSRVNPWSMTEADFLTEYEVDEATKSVKRLTTESETP